MSFFVEIINYNNLTRLHTIIKISDLGVLSLLIKT